MQAQGISQLSVMSAYWYPLRSEGDGSDSDVRAQCVPNFFFEITRCFALSRNGYRPIGDDDVVSGAAVRAQKFARPDFQAFRGR